MDRSNGDLPELCIMHGNERRQEGLRGEGTYRTRSRQMVRLVLVGLTGNAWSVLIGGQKNNIANLRNFSHINTRAQS